MAENKVIDSDDKVLLQELNENGLINENGLLMTFKKAEEIHSDVFSDSTSVYFTKKLYFRKQQRHESVFIVGYLPENAIIYKIPCGGKEIRTTREIIIRRAFLMVNKPPLIENIDDDLPVLENDDDGLEHIDDDLPGLENDDDGLENIDDDLPDTYQNMSRYNRSI